METGVLIGDEVVPGDTRPGTSIYSLVRNNR
jgi:hypothetical protein